jgi:hypothetical protein
MGGEWRGRQRHMLAGNRNAHVSLPTQVVLPGDAVMQLPEKGQVRQQMTTDMQMMHSLRHCWSCCQVRISAGIL